MGRPVKKHGIYTPTYNQIGFSSKFIWIRPQYFYVITTQGVATLTSCNNGLNVVYLCLNGRKIEGNRLQVYLICRNSAKYLIFIREKAQFWIFWPKLSLIIKNRHIPTKNCHDGWKQEAYILKPLMKNEKMGNYLWLRFINFHLPSICSAISYKFISIVPEFPLNSDIFCKNSLEIRCLNKFRFDIRPLYLNFYSLINSRIVSSVLEWWRHLTAFLPPLDSPQRDENLPRENVCCG